MEKRGQVTVFVIIAIVLVAGVIAVFTLNDGVRDFLSETFMGKDEKAIIIENYVNFCLEEALDKALFYNGLQGGYFITPDNSIYYESENLTLSRNIPYYLDKSKKILTEEDLSDQLSLSVRNNFEECLDFDSLNEINSNLSYNVESISLKSILNIDQVKIELNFPVSINLGEKQILLREFNVEKETNYLLLYFLSIELTDIQLEYENAICLSCISTLAEENDLNIGNNEAKGVNESEYVIVYQLNKNNNDKVEIFSFAHKFYRSENEN